MTRHDQEVCLMDISSFIRALRELGFGDDDADIGGADTVDVINSYWDDLLKIRDRLMEKT